MPSSPAVRAADATVTIVLVVGLTALMALLAGVAAWLGLGPDPCLGDRSGRCADVPVGPRMVAWTMVGGLVLVWGVTVWRVVVRLRAGAQAWTVPILGAGAAVLLTVVGTILMGVVG